jgi:hypothetical protein
MNPNAEFLMALLSLALAAVSVYATFKRLPGS